MNNFGKLLAPVHPGDILSNEIMLDKGWSAETVAQKTKIELSKIQDLINGKIAIDGGLAKKLGELFETSPTFWFNLQKGFEIESIESKIKSRMMTAGVSLSFDELNNQKAVLCVLSTIELDEGINISLLGKIISVVKKVTSRNTFGIPNFDFVQSQGESILVEIIQNMIRENFVVETSKSESYTINDTGRKIGIRLTNKIPYEIKKEIKIVVNKIVEKKHSKVLEYS